MVPSGGTYDTCRPVVLDSVPPPVTAQLTSALVFARTAENPVGPVICTVPDGSDGLMLSDGPGFVGPHPQSDAPTATPAATIM
ncbi:MAG TPA: hypothetical protein VHN14_23125, partial [Kofleriaceae bacterium]|nr:hypothetical protein [Kofleriaceae bacterium]